MKRFLATAATSLVLGTSAYAEAHTSAFSDMTFDQASNLYASELIGMRVYATEAEIENEIEADGETEWDDIGEINDIILTRDGQVSSVIVGVGGFLSIGEKDVAVDMSQIKFVAEEGESDDFFLVISANAAGVEEAPAFERGMDDHADMTDEDKAAMADGDNTAMADTDTTMSDDRMMLTAPSVERDGYQNVKVEDLNTEDLTGARVYGSDDEDVGEISELLLTDDGKLDRAVIDVGGFLGMGERPVAVTMEELQIMRTDDGDDVRVYIESTEDALKQLPEYDG
ncbi:PRC-barrel domain-containing protein [Roseivivax sp. CAU 1753]